MLTRVTQTVLVVLQFLLVVSGVYAELFSSTLYALDSTHQTFKGSVALADARRAVGFGERPSGSDNIVRLREWITSQLRPLGGQLFEDRFSAQTPAGAVEMTNLILRFPGSSGRAIAVTGHYDTKKIPMVQFLGANDGGSSTGFLIEFAHVMANTTHKDDIYVVFFDGEEAVGQWSDKDSIYGSKHLAANWASDGLLGRLKALINVDMIGDKDLDILNDSNSNAGLVKAMLDVAEKEGDAKYFHKDVQGIEDDHMPFASSGVSVLDVIDFNYGPNNAYWHTNEDTMDKLSEHSLQVVGNVVVALVKLLDR